MYVDDNRFATFTEVSQYYLCIITNRLHVFTKLLPFSRKLTADLSSPYLIDCKFLHTVTIILIVPWSSTIVFLSVTVALGELLTRTFCYNLIFVIVVNSQCDSVVNSDANSTPNLIPKVPHGTEVSIAGKIFHPLLSEILKVVSDKPSSVKASTVILQDRVRFQTVDIWDYSWLPDLISISNYTEITSNDVKPCFSSEGHVASHHDTACTKLCYPIVPAIRIEFSTSPSTFGCKCHRQNLESLLNGPNQVPVRTLTVGT